MAHAKKVSVKNRFKSFRQPGLFIVSFGLIGVALVLATRAVTPVNNAIEPENGTTNANAVVSSDKTYVTFTAGSTGGSGTVTGGTDTSCQFQKADAPVNVAFCEGFNKDFNNDKSLNRSGGLDSTLWGVSRAVSLYNSYDNNYYFPAHLVGCGATQVVFPTKDVQVCSGRLQEAVNDGAGGGSDTPTNSLSALAMYPKQPFDISGGRTGTVVFDVSADSGGVHQAWPEFWWTDQPTPIPGDDRSSWSAYARNSFGFTINEQCPTGKTGIGTVLITTNYAQKSVYDAPYEGASGSCLLSSGSPTGALNHFEVRLSATRFEIYGTDAGSSTLKLLASGNVTMPLTKGLTWMEDVHYNACKFGPPQCDHPFAWDNFGFDGPKTYRDLAFDVPDANIPHGSGAVDLGYGVPASSPRTLQVKGVYRLQTPTSALVTFNYFPALKNAAPSISINGNPYIDTPWPYAENETYTWRTLAVIVPVSQINDGTNTITFKNAEDTVVSNIDLILVAGSPTP